MNSYGGRGVRRHALFDANRLPSEVVRLPRSFCYLGQRLATLHALPIVGDVRGLGLLWGVELVRDKVTKAPFERARQVSERIARECFVRGLLVVSGAGAADGIDGDTITLAPPLTISKEEIDELVGLLGDAIRAVGLEIDSG